MSDILMGVKSVCFSALTDGEVTVHVCCLLRQVTLFHNAYVELSSATSDLNIYRPLSIFLSVALNNQPLGYKWVPSSLRCVTVNFLTPHRQLTWYRELAFFFELGVLFLFC